LKKTKNKTGCYPFTDRDPFILEQTPHVYFIGNQPEFESKLVEQDGKKVRIVLVPKFSETGQIVLVNSKSLEVKVIGFEA
jgi:DNA polymerase delta subunit 2